MLYRICTENLNQSAIRKLINANGFDGSTIIEGKGEWNGKPELSLIIEIDCPCPCPDKVRALAKDIKAVNHQEAVLIQEIDSRSSLV